MSMTIATPAHLWHCSLALPYAKRAYYTENSRMEILSSPLKFLSYLVVISKFVSVLMVMLQIALPVYLLFLTAFWLTQP